MEEVATLLEKEKIFPKQAVGSQLRLIVVLLHQQNVGTKTTLIQQHFTTIAQKTWDGR